MGDAAGQVASLADVDLGMRSTVVQLVSGSDHNCALHDNGHMCAPRPLSPPWMGCFRLA